MGDEYSFVQTLYYHRFNIMNVALMLLTVISTINLVRKIIRDKREHERYKQFKCGGDPSKWSCDNSISVSVENSRVRSIFSTNTGGDGNHGEGDVD
ncbi:hypothetical protein VP489E541_P0044 [Vibrio phage 489E54-1]|nr:hypothetical protein VP489E541_P0044 [Vibrio phage 489E54-1]